MSSGPTAPHGWPDGEARPLPYGQVLASVVSSVIEDASPVYIGPFEIGAWPALAVMVNTAGVPVLVSIYWELLDVAATIGPTVILHPGDGSVMLVQSLGHRIEAVQIELNPTTGAFVFGTSLTYMLTGSNLTTRQSVPRARYIKIPDPAAGTGDVTLYTVPAHIQAYVLGIFGRLTQLPRAYLVSTATFDSDPVTIIDVFLADADGDYYATSNIVEQPPPEDNSDVLGGVSDPATTTLFAGVNQLAASFGGSGSWGIDPDVSRFVKYQNLGLGLDFPMPGGHSVVLRSRSRLVDLYRFGAGMGEANRGTGQADPNLFYVVQDSEPTDQFTQLAILVREETITP